MKKVYKKLHQYKKSKPILFNRFFKSGILILVAFLGGGYFIIFSSIFQIKEYQITGNQKIPVKDLQNIIEGQIEQKILFFSSKSIFLVNSKKINNAILEKFPQIAGLNLKREFPDKLSLVVQEREPVAIFIHQGSNFFVDEHGILFERITEAQPMQFLEIRSYLLAGLTEPNLGERAITKELLLKILEIRFKLKENLEVFIKEALLVSDQRLNIKTFEGWEIYFNLKESLDWQIIELGLVLEKKIPFEKRKELEYIDLRFDRVYYRYR